MYWSSMAKSTTMKICGHHMQGVSFRGHSDTETLLQALATRGTTAISDLNGIFAFAWLNIEAQRLYLARDSFGVKPLYYTRSGNGLCFASELKPLLQIVPTGVDTRHLATLLKLHFSITGHTPAWCASPPPGHILEIRLDSQTPELREFPFISAVRQTTSPPPMAAAVSQYGALFEQAVKRQLMSDVEVGVLLSGGIDSALVAAIAQKTLLTAP